MILASFLIDMTNHKIFCFPKTFYAFSDNFSDNFLIIKALLVYLDLDSLNENQISALDTLWLQIQSCDLLTFPEIAIDKRAEAIAHEINDFAAILKKDKS